MIALILQVFLLYVISLVLWLLVKRTLVRSPLDNVAGPTRQSLAGGNLAQFFDPKMGRSFHDDILERFGKVVKIHGMFGEKRLYVSDPLALYHILLKDGPAYEPTDLFLSINSLAFGNGLLSTIGNAHRKQRKMLNPAFSANHMREMVPMFYQISHKLRDVLVSRVSNGPKEIDVLEWMSRTALELIGRSGLGYSFDSLEEDTVNPYTGAVKAFFPTISSFFIPVLTLPWTSKLGSPGFRRFLVEIMPWKRGQSMRHIIDTMTNTSREVFETKKRALERGEEAVLQQVGEGKDIMSILLRANMEASDEDRLSDEELLAQMSSLIFAAMDTTSTALSCTLHILAEHPDVQEKLRAEISAARLSQGDLGYDELSALPFLDAVCRETLRLYAPVPLMSRTTQRDTVLPFSQPVRGVDGTELHSIPIPKDTDVIIGILAINRDRSIWGEDALDWKPERWLSPLPESVRNAQIPGVYSNTMTFLGGGRACIGFKFSQLEMKVVLSLLLESLRFSTAKEIDWNLTVGMQTPSIRGSKDLKPTLPLNISLVTSTGF